MKLDKETLDNMVKAGGQFQEVSPEAREAFRQAALKANEDFIRRYPDVWEKFQEVTRPFRKGS